MFLSVAGNIFSLTLVKENIVGKGENAVNQHEVVLQPFYHHGKSLTFCNNSVKHGQDRKAL